MQQKQDTLGFLRGSVSASSAYLKYSSGNEQTDSKRWWMHTFGSHFEEVVDSGLHAGKVYQSRRPNAATCTQILELGMRKETITNRDETNS